MKDNAHHELFSPATLILGKIHWTILKATSLMDAIRWEKRQSTGGLVSDGFTDFGKEIGLDEIHWWVFKKESNVSELRAETERALRSAQVLKEASHKLGNRHPESYKELLSTLREFAGRNVREAELLYDYVRWLERRDPMAPRILFTYRVWGSTRMSDRRIEIAPDTPMTDKILQNAAEIVLGVRMDGRRVYDDTYNELAFEMYDTMDPEQLSYLGRINVPAGRVVGATARAVYQECASYFTQLRDSLRNILIDVEKFEEQRDLIHSDRFWRELIVKAVRSRKVEPQLWDFKETLTMWHVKQQPERDEAKVTFAEDVAGLANTRGGVLIIGVNDRREIVGLGNSSRDLENRLKTASYVIARHVEYDRDIVWFQQVAVPVENEEKICVVVVVAQACNTVGVRDGQGRYTYPVRHETGIVRVSQSDVSVRKAGLKSDNHDFIRGLKQFIDDN